ncbi:MAG: hypothetical protein JEZ00_21350 [Anaerolineaceae bacterium]|nr:hypothetical protein [Anaerolineaceae bacterium]
MNETSTEEFFTPKHKQLYTIAKWANVFSWVLLVFFLLSLAQNIFSTNAQFNASYNGPATGGLFGYLFENLDALFFYATTWLTTLVKGIVYFLVLRGASLGMNMIVETDLNYRESAQEVSHVE